MKSIVFNEMIIFWCDINIQGIRYDIQELAISTFYAHFKPC
ncbi:hypothetical protein T11_1321 [Trichinella zimbabwensis]|uniref:Uncharacterized protein n=1 Tax=Trichinella zimbabwensis TaxID=268475 RepID=A0A0V1GCP5_9BILA|nr:hypothetical protein T11_1321 [Trichinella zimbabwensis]